VGETVCAYFGAVVNVPAFSILERIDVGETTPWRQLPRITTTFSILERIDVGETT